MRDGVQRQQIDLTLAAATFVTGIMKFYKQVSVMNICFTKLMTYWELMNLNYTFHSPLILGSVTRNVFWDSICVFRLSNQHSYPGNLL